MNLMMFLIEKQVLSIVSRKKAIWDLTLVESLGDMCCYTGLATRYACTVSMSLSPKGMLGSIANTQSQ